MMTLFCSAATGLVDGGPCVRTDLNDDGIVDFVDFAMFAETWQQTGVYMVVIKRKDNTMNNRKAFTIVELLTSVAIIALLWVSCCLQSAMIRTKAKETAQKAQFSTIEMALDAFKQDYGDYPPSNWSGCSACYHDYNYCGAQKLTEALLGWDLMGFHPKYRLAGRMVTLEPLCP